LLIITRPFALKVTVYTLFFIHFTTKPVTMQTVNFCFSDFAVKMRKTASLLANFAFLHAIFYSFRRKSTYTLIRVFIVTLKTAYNHIPLWSTPKFSLN